MRSIVSTGIDAYPPRLEALHGFDEIISWYGTNQPEFREAASSFPIQFLDALPNSEGVHAVDYFMGQVGGVKGAVPRIDVPRADAGFIAVHPFSGSSKKNWPHFRELIERLRAKVCVSPEQQWPGAVQYENLYDLARWLATAGLYIGNDSGITHLAAAVGVPVIAIFQASNPAVWSPRGKDVVMLEQPTLDTVIAAAQNRLRSA